MSRKSVSRGEEALLLQLRAEKLPLPEREYTFFKGRKWRFDFAYTEHRIAIEVEGGTWSKGRHNRGQGFQNDCVKYNAATALGWRVFRYTTEMVVKGEAIAQIKDILEEDIILC